ncbi:MAG TPA: hypothetical protein EYG92_09560 [Lutibacter sp.]|nr:hypothetical protein [Lutibacter sp.]
MKKVKKVLMWFALAVVLLLFIIIKMNPVTIESANKSIDTNSTEYKEQYAIAIAKMNRESKEEQKNTNNNKAKKVSAAKLSKALVSLDFKLNIKKYSVVLADFTIRNESAGELTDIEIRCSHFSSTSRRLAKKVKVLYVAVPKNSVKKVKGFSMGVTHPQAVKSSCEILSYAFEGLRVWY